MLLDSNIVIIVTCYSVVIDIGSNSCYLVLIVIVKVIVVITSGTWAFAEWGRRRVR